MTESLKAKSDRLANERNSLRNQLREVTAERDEALSRVQVLLLEKAGALPGSPFAQMWHAFPDDSELHAVLAAAACPAPCVGVRQRDGGQDWHETCESRADDALAALRGWVGQASPLSEAEQALWDRPEAYPSLTAGIRAVPDKPFEGGHAEQYKALDLRFRA